MRVIVTVKANSKKGPLVENCGLGNFLIYTRQPAINGKANQEVIKLLAEYYQVAKNSVRIVRGEKTNKKLVEVISSTS